MASTCAASMNTSHICLYHHSAGPRSPGARHEHTEDSSTAGPTTPPRQHGPNAGVSLHLSWIDCEGSGAGELFLNALYNRKLKVKKATALYQSESTYKSGLSSFMHADADKESQTETSALFLTISCILITLVIPITLIPHADADAYLLLSPGCNWLPMPPKGGDAPYSPRSHCGQSPWPRREHTLTPAVLPPVASGTRARALLYAQQQVRGGRAGLLVQQCRQRHTSAHHHFVAKALKCQSVCCIAHSLTDQRMNCPSSAFLVSAQ